MMWSSTARWDETEISDQAEKKSDAPQAWCGGSASRRLGRHGSSGTWWQTGRAQIRGAYVLGGKCGVVKGVEGWGGLQRSGQLEGGARWREKRLPASYNRTWMRCMNQCRYMDPYSYTRQICGSIFVQQADLCIRLLTWNVRYRTSTVMVMRKNIMSWCRSWAACVLVEVWKCGDSVRNWTTVLREERKRGRCHRKKEVDALLD